MEVTQLDMYLPTHRKHDQLTSVMAGADVVMRAGSQKFKLLVCYTNTNNGLTDEEAGERSGLLAKRTCYWRRCSDLREFGLIRDTGTTRKSSLGKDMMVCVITDAGRELLRSFERKEGKDE